MIRAIYTTLGLYVLTAVSEILGCFLVYRRLRHDGGLWLLLPAAICLGAFAYLLSLHPGAAGRTYAAYGAVYVATAMLWLWWIEGQRPTVWDLVGVVVCLVGMGIIVLGTRAP
jgi:small multidrug resistance family-3 protein